MKLLLQFKNTITKFVILTMLISVAIIFTFLNFARAELLNYDDWKKRSDVYRPHPILFLHGFASGNPQVWDEANERLKGYFEIYYDGFDKLPHGDSPVGYLPDTTNFYLERLCFFNPDEPKSLQLIDRNSSIDTYQTGDYYVTTGKRNNGDPGWSDEVKDKVLPILDAYGTEKLLLVCHSMGGLAGREYFKDFNGGNYAVRLVTLATPHLGSHWATIDQQVIRTQKIGWFMPFIGWEFSYDVEVVDISLQHLALIDMSGDAVRDMTPGSSFLTVLNNSAQPANVDYFAIAGDVMLHSGDGVVSLSSARGEGILTLKDEAIVEASHGDVPRVASEGAPSPLLKFIDSTKPVVRITSPDPNASPITKIHTPTITVEGTIDKEYLPADTDFTIKVVRDQDNIVVFEKLYSQRVFPFANSVPTPAGFKEVDVNLKDGQGLLKEGTYTISIVATNPAGISSDQSFTWVNVVVNKPVITDINPTGNITNRRPTIQARIYSPDTIDIDLSSIELKLDDKIVTHIVTPQAGGPDITISYTPPNELFINDPNTSGINEGKHTITVNAKDDIGLIANEKKGYFEIFSFCPGEIVRYMRAINEREKVVGLGQTTFYNLTTGGSLGTPDGGINIPSLNVLADCPFLSEYIYKIRLAIERMMNYQDSLDGFENTGAYWDISTNTKWTLKTLYRASMGTSGSGPGLDTWTHSSSQMKANGVEAIDLDEIQKCIMRLETLRLPVTRASSIASYLSYAIIDYGWWDGSQYRPDGIGDKLYYPVNLIFGDQGWSGPISRQHYNSTTRIFFGGNIKNFSGLNLKDAKLYITVSISEGDPSSLGSCHVGHFLLNVNPADFQKPVQAVIANVPITNGTFTFTVTPYIQQDISNGRIESWYKGWFDQLTDYEKDPDRVKWWPEFIISPSFRNP